VTAARLSSSVERSPAGEAERRVALARGAEDAGDLDRAREGYLAALAAGDDRPLVHHRLGCLYFRQGDPATAVAFFARACELAPEWPEAQHDFGVAAMATGFDADAARAFGNAARLRPELIESTANRVALLTRLGLPEHALDEASAALERHPDDARLWTGVSAALLTLDLAGAEQAAIRAVQLDPAQPAAWLCLGGAAARREDDGAAIEAYRHGLDLDPAHAELHTALGLALLRAGELRAGFDEYEWRFRAPAYRRQAPATHGLPVWRGEPPNGRRILLLQEQGHGDTLQFIRYARSLADLGARVTALVPEPLVRLVSRVSGIECAAASLAALPPADACCPIVSLPQRFATELGSLPGGVAYLSPDPRDVERYGDMLAADRVPADIVRVGFAWAGAAHANDARARRVDARRSIAFDTLAEVMGVPGIAPYSLQMGAVPPCTPGTPPVVDHMGTVRDFAHTAALIRHLDLVVTVDTSIAHLAAGMGKPTWVLSRFDGCWRWFQGREDSPWYPSTRLFRQENDGDWRRVAERLGHALRGYAAGMRRVPDTEICTSIS
jgi:tetratricopeptide (TPR) repeat protein